MALKLVAILLVTIFLAHDTYATSRGLGLNRSNSKKVEYGFSAELQHVDADKDLTQFERLQRAIERGSRRAKRIEEIIQSSTSSGLGVVAPLSPGEGEYTMSLAIGTPAQTYSAIMDTGSDLIWTQCQPCTQCFNQTTPIFDPTLSSSFSVLSCYSQFCTDLPQETCSNNQCQYSYGYGDGSNTQGYMGSETFTLGSAPQTNIAFGCGTQNQGFGTGPAGLVGMGGGPLSMPSQLGASQFSYYLPSMNDASQSSTLGFGSAANGTTTASTITTPLVQNPNVPTFYYFAPTGISVGGNQLSIPANAFTLNSDGSGGMIIDSGTTLFYLVQNVYSIVRQAFIDSTNLTPVSAPSSGLDLCFQLPSDSSNLQLPSLVLNFANGNLELPTSNYFVLVSQQVICLAMGSQSGMSIYGNIAQGNTLVLYNTAASTLSFTPNF
ncbi:Aspartic proteinase nepenthesin-1-like protein [Drosera capensis]